MEFAYYEKLTWLSNWPIVICNKNRGWQMNGKIVKSITYLLRHSNILWCIQQINLCDNLGQSQQWATQAFIVHVVVCYDRRFGCFLRTTISINFSISMRLHVLISKKRPTSRMNSPKSRSIATLTIYCVHEMALKISLVLNLFALLMHSHFI